MAVCSLKVFLLLVSMADDLLISKSSNEPQLPSILFRNGVQHVVKLSQCFLELFHLKQAEHSVVRVLMNVQ